MKISILKPAQVDLEEAVRCYDGQRVGLGAEFASAVLTTLQVTR